MKIIENLINKVDISDGLTKNDNDVDCEIVELSTPARTLQEHFSIDSNSSWEPPQVALLNEPVVLADTKTSSSSSTCSSSPNKVLPIVGLPQSPRPPLRRKVLKKKPSTSNTKKRENRSASSAKETNSRKLPAGWITYTKKRTGGKSKGNVDTYYKCEATGKVCRTWREMQKIAKTEGH